MTSDSIATDQDDAGLSSDRLLALLQVSRGLVSELDLEALLERILTTAQELTGARYAALGILDDDRLELERFLTRGVDDEVHAAIGDLPRGRGILGLLIEDPQPLRLADVGLHARSYGFPSGHPAMASFLGVPILVRGQAWGNLYLTEKHSGPFTRADEEAAILLAEWAAIAIHNARLYERETSRRRELEHAVQALEASTTIARSLGGETDLDRILELVVKRGRALVEARAMLMLLVDGDTLVVHAEAGQIIGTAVGRRVAMDRLTGRVLAQATARRVDDIGGQLLFSADDFGIADATTALVAPLVYRAQGIGVLVAFDRLVDGPRFHLQDEALAMGFAASAATAVSTAQSVESERLALSIASAEQERRRWARELHDATLHGVGAARARLTAAQEAQDLGALDRAVTEVVAELDREIRALRALICDLRPAELDEGGVVPAVEALVERSRGLHGLQIELDADLAYDRGRAGTRLVPETETAIYRTAQEAITNVARHARASRVQITLTESGGRVRLVVADDGDGIDDTRRPAGFGLVGMRERAELGGGNFEIESSSDGTTVRFELPAVHRDAPQQQRESA